MILAISRQRSLSMLAKNCDGVLPARPRLATRSGSLAQPQATGKNPRSDAGLCLHMILTEIWRVVSEANRYFASEEPWSTQERSGAYANHSLRDRRNFAYHRHHGAAVHASFDGKAARPLKRPASERTFAHAEIAQGLVTGSSCWPRYRFFRVTSKRRKIIAKRSPVLIDSHSTSTRYFAAERDAGSNAPAPLGLGG